MEISGFSSVLLYTGPRQPALSPLPPERMGGTFAPLAKGEVKREAFAPLPGGQLVIQM